MKQPKINALQGTSNVELSLKLWAKLYRIFVLITLGVSPPIALGQESAIRYVTDELTVEMYESPDKNSPALKKIPSNSKLYVIETRNNFSLVEDQAKVKGWIENSSITKTVPVRLAFSAVKNENKALITEIESLQNRLDMQITDKESDQDLLKENTSLKGKLSDQKLKNGHLKAEIASLQADLKSKSVPPSAKIIGLERNLSQMKKEANNSQSIIRELEARVSNEPSLILTWVTLRHHSGLLITVALVACLAMFFLGFWICDSLARRRHGGFRL